MSQQFGKKKINIAINAITAMAKETDILVTGVKALDESGKYNVPEDILVKIADRVIQKSPGITLMILVAGETECSALVRVNPEIESKLTGQEWVENIGLTVPSNDQQSTSQQSNSRYNYVYGVLSDVDSTLKKKDELNSQAFGVLREKKLFIDDSDDDDQLPYFDW